MHPNMRQRQGIDIASFEPGEDWFFDYEKQGMIKGVEFFSTAFASEKPARSWPGGKGAG